MLDLWLAVSSKCDVFRVLSEFIGSWWLAFIVNVKIIITLQFYYLCKY